MEDHHHHLHHHSHHQNQKEFQLLPVPAPAAPPQHNNTIITTSSSSSDSLLKLGRPTTTTTTVGPRLTEEDNVDHGPLLDLQLSTNLIPIINNTINSTNSTVIHDQYHTHQFHHHPARLPAPQLGTSTSSNSTIKTLKWQAAEQICLATIEKAYAERMREVSRREMEIAQNEFSLARNLRDRAKEELDKAQFLKLRAINNVHRDSSSCTEITCHSCRQKFLRP